MSKCNSYPHCECYMEWEKPAAEIDGVNSGIIVSLKQELQNYLDTTHPIKCEHLLQNFKTKLEILPNGLHGLFISKWLSIIDSGYSWKFSEKSDLIRLRKALLNEFSATNDLSYYTDKENIRNQNLVNETIEYFDTGAGARAFKSLEFLNLLEKQRDFVNQNFKDGNKVISSLKALPYNDLERHILFGLILKWSGGYPVNILDEDFNNTLKIIEIEFLGYPGDTPEKEFCKANNEQRKHFMKLGIAFTTAINYNIDVRDILQQMPETSPSTKSYSTFDALFEDAAGNEVFGEITNTQLFLIERSRYNFEFNVWLQESKGWEYNNENEYKKHLTKEIFMEFLKFKKTQQQERNVSQLKEKESWKIEPALKQKEVAEWYYGWLHLPVEDKYQIAKKAYYEKFPEGNISDFHLMEIESLENRLRDPNRYPNKLKDHDSYDIKFVVEVRKMLKYYQELEYSSNSIIRKNEIVDKVHDGTTITESAVEKGDAEQYLFFMKNINPKNQFIILNERYYPLLILYSNEFLKTGIVPKNVQVIPKINMTNVDIIYTFREMYKAEKPGEKGKFPFEFFDFLSKVFSQLHVPNLCVYNLKQTSLYKKGAVPSAQYKSLIKG